MVFKLIILLLTSATTLHQRKCPHSGRYTIEEMQPDTSASTSRRQRRSARAARTADRATWPYYRDEYCKNVEIGCSSTGQNEMNIEVSCDVGKDGEAFLMSILSDRQRKEKQNNNWTLSFIQNTSATAAGKKTVRCTRSLLQKVSYRRWVQSRRTVSPCEWTIRRRKYKDEGEAEAEVETNTNKSFSFLHTLVLVQETSLNGHTTFPVKVCVHWFN